MDPTAAEYAIQGYEISDVDLLSELESFDVVLNDCVDKSPALRQAEFQLMASQAQLNRSRAELFPTLTASGGFFSRYSSNGARNPETGEIEFDADYLTQMDYNFGQTAGITLRIPVFNRYSTMTNIQVAKINRANAELSNQQSYQDVVNAVQSVYLDLVAAQTTYISARDNLEALDQSFQFMEKRYETGNTDFYTYLEALNNKNRAEIQLINARYSIVLRKKILDTYRLL
jgi:outer membrane protein